MPAPAQIITHGAREEQIGPLRWRLRARDFDSCFMSIDSQQEDYVKPGSPLPGYAHMRAVDVQPEQQGNDWIFNNTEYKGFKDPAETWRVFSQSKNSPSEGFDNISLMIGTREPAHARFARGATAPTKDDVPPEFAHMWIVDRTDDETDIVDMNGRALYSQLQLQLRGLLGPKPYTRRVSTGSQTMTPSGNWLMYDSINDAGEPVTGLLSYGSVPVEISLPKLVVTDSFVTLTEPPFAGIPGNVTPDDAPGFTLFVFTSYTGVRYYWPHGWRRASISSEQIPGKQCWFWSVSYEFQQYILPA